MKQTVEQFVECRRLVLKENVEVVSLAPQGHISERICDQIVEDPVPPVVEQFVARFCFCARACES